MRNLTKTLAILSLLTPVVGYPLGVGDIKLHSALNQNLNAEIPLTLSDGESVADIRVGLASAAKFDEKGVPWTYFLSKIRFQVVSGKSASSAVIKVSSQEALKEPFLNLVLEVSSSKGSLYREFTVLVDPPPAYQAPTTPVSKSIAPSAMASNPATAAIASVASTKLPTATVTPVRETSSSKIGSYGPVHKKETLWSIAVKFSKEQGVTVNQMLMAIYETNPDAFSADNAFGLIPNVVLQIPSSDVATRLSNEQAKAAYESQKKTWKSRETSPRTATVTPPKVAANEIVAPTINKVSAPITSAAKTENIFAPDNQGSVLVDQAVPTLAHPAPAKAKEKIVQPTVALPRVTEKPPVAVAEPSAPVDTALVNKVATLEKQLNATKKALATKEKQIEKIKSQSEVTSATVADIKPPVTTKPVETKLADVKPPVEIKPADEKPVAAKPVIPLGTLSPITPFEAPLPAAKIEAVKSAIPLNEIAKTVAVAKPFEVKLTDAKPAEVKPPVAPVSTNPEIKPIVPPVAPVTAHTEVKPAVPPVAPVSTNPEIKPIVPPVAPVTAHTEVKPPVAPVSTNPEVKPIVPPVAPVSTNPEVKPIVPPVAPVSTNPEVKPTVPPIAPVSTNPEVKPIVPPPVVKPLESPEESGILELEPEYLAAGGIAALTILSILGFWFRNRRRAMEEPMFPPSTKVEFKGASSSPSSETESSLNISFNPDEFKGKSIFEPDWNIDIEEPTEIDPISEADVYLAYARYQQAEELMRDAIKEQPNRNECKLKLLEIFYASENRDDFEQYAAELVQAGKKADTDFWEKVTEMGSEICPDSLLFSATEPDDVASTLGTTEVKNAESQQANNKDDFDTFDLDDFSDSEANNSSRQESHSSILDTLSDFEDDKSTARPTSNDDFDDFDLDGKAEVIPAPASIATPASSKDDFESFDFDDFDLDSKAEAEVIPAPASVATPAASKDDFESFDFDDFDLDSKAEAEVIPAPASVATPAASKDDFESFDFDDFDLDSKAEAEVIPAPASVATPAASKDDFESFDFDDFDLDSKAEAEVIPAPASVATPAASKDDFESFDFDDFDLDSKAEAEVIPAPASVATPAASKDDFESFDFDDFDLDSKAEAAPTSVATDAISKDDFESFDFDGFDLDSKAEAAPASAAIDAISKDDFESFDFDDFDLDSKAENAPAPAASEDDIESFDFDLTANEPNSFDVTKSENSSIDNLDLDFDFDMPMGSTNKNQQGRFGSPDLTEMDDFETKLDLANAYIEMGDPSAARDIVEEVIQKGSAGQKKTAEEILHRLK